MVRWFFLVLMLGFVRVPHAFAATEIVFDFESVSVFDVPGAVLFDAPIGFVIGGLEMTVSHESGVQFAVNARSQTAYTERYGTNSLSAFNGSGGESSRDPGAFIFDFDKELTSVSVDMGDFGQDSDSMLLQAFSGVNASGTLLAQDTAFMPALAGFHYETLSVEALGIRSIRVIGGSEAFPNSVFIDNVTTVVAIPEPSTHHLLLISVAVGVLLRRPRRSFGLRS